MDDFDKYKQAAKNMDNGEAHPHLALQWWPDIEFDTRPRSLVKGMLGVGECSVTYGNTGTGKSFKALDLGLHVALGRPWFNRPTMQAIVVYVAVEAGASVRRRIVAFRQHHGLSTEDDIPFALIASPINLLDASPDLPALVHEIEAAKTRYPDLPVLVILDTLSRALAGGDENSSADMGNLVRHIDRLREATGAHVLIVHHTGKAVSQGARGHSLLRAAVDTEIEVSRPEGSKQSVALVTKQRDEDIGASVAFRLRVVEIGHNDEGDIVTSCVVEPVEGPVDAPARGKANPRPQPVEYLRAVDFLRDIVAEIGKPVDRPGLPNLKAVTLDQWRDYLKKRGLYEPETSTGRSRFQRMRERLVAARLITIDADLVWPVPRPTAVVAPFPQRDDEP